MASGINYVTVLGNLTRDPDLRYTPNGTPVASFAIAVNKRIQDKSSGEWSNSADFFNIVTWFKLAENCAESLGKGDRVLVTGRLSQESWNDKDGQKRSAYRIIANIVAPSLEFATCKIDKNARVEMPVSQKEESGEELTEGDLDFNDEDIPF